MFSAKLIKIDINENFNSLLIKQQNNDISFFNFTQQQIYILLFITLISLFSVAVFKRCSHTRVNNSGIKILLGRHMLPEKTSNSILCHNQSKKLSLNVYSAPPYILWCQRDEMSLRAL